jgi:photosystem II core protein PsbZ
MKFIRKTKLYNIIEYIAIIIRNIKGFLSIKYSRISIQVRKNLNYVIQWLLTLKLKTRKGNVIGILPLFVVLLIIVSFAMVVAVPVILATPGEWEKSQAIVWSGSGLWSALVVLAGLFTAVPA